jgi:hypothetical protein
MKKLLASASAFCALAALSVGSASAADLRRPVVRSAPVAIVAPMNWTGFYAGFNAGVSKLETAVQENWIWNYSFPPGTFATDGSTFGGNFNTGVGNTDRRSATGFIGGLQWGYNWQVGGLLVGFEGAWTKEKNTYSTGGSVPLIFAPVQSGVNIVTLPVNQGTALGWTSEEKAVWDRRYA